MSDSHKAALAKGREEGATVRRYLEALEATKPKRGRRRTPDSIKKRLAALDSQIASAPNPLARLQLMQERRDLSSELDRSDGHVDVAGLEKGFIKVAKSYGDRKGITYGTWRSAGVSASVLRSAGVARTRG